MPLLMKEPEQGPLPEEAEIEIGADLAGAVVARRGQLLTITDVEGRQPAALFGITLANPREFLSPHHTRVFSNSFMLRLGMRLVTNRRRPILVLGKDTVDSNDLLFPAVDNDYLARHGQPGRAGAVENALQAFADAGIEPPKLPDPINLFLNVDLTTDGALVPGPLRSRAGDHVTFRVVIDATFVVATTAKDVGHWSEGSSTPLKVRVHNWLD